MANTEVALHSVRKFNPGLLQSDEEVTRQFVVRQHEFAVVRDVLCSNIDAPSCQHVLVVAPRGRGKTMLLARVAAEIRRDGGLARRLLPVQFMEESQEIYGLADFWLETLFHLAREVAIEDVAHAKDLSATHAALASRWREAGVDELARAAVLEAADRLGRRLVLMVENVQSLFGAVDEGFGWGMRAVLQTTPQVMLIASATSRFEGLEDPQAPFFELFRMVHLEPLTTEECGKLWEMVTKHAPRTQEIRPLEILTGGSPRLIVLVAAFARHRSLRQLMEELVALVDEHTDYFRSHLESLPKNERRVFVSLVDLWQASSTGEIAARARLDVRVVSTMLGRLVQRGAVTVVGGRDGGKRLYAASERLYSIYYKVRRERDEAAVVEALIHFMVAFYDLGEFYQVFEQLMQDAIDSTAVEAGIDRALARRNTVDALPLRVKWQEIERTSDKVKNRRRTEALLRLDENASTAYEDKDWTGVLDIVDRYVADGWVDAESGRQREHRWAHLAHLRSDAHFMLKRFQEVIAIGDEVSARLGRTRDVTLESRFCAIALNRAGAYYELADYPKARSESASIVRRFGEHSPPWYDVQVAAALALQADAEGRLGDPGSAAALFDQVVERFGDSDETDVQRSVLRALQGKAELMRKQKEHRGAAKIYAGIVERLGNSEHPVIREGVNSARLNRGFVLGASGDFEDELAAYGEVVAAVAGWDAPAGLCWPAHVASMYKGRRLAELGRAEEALASCDVNTRWLAASSDECPAQTLRWMDWHVKGTRALALAASGETVAAMDAFRSACSAFPYYFEMATGEMLRLVPELVAAGAPEAELVTILSSDERCLVAMRPLMVALRERAGESVRAPAEVLEVAADLRKCIEKRLVTGVMPGFRLHTATSTRESP